MGLGNRRLFARPVVAWLAIALLGGPAAPVRSEVPQPPGWKVAFADDFNGPADRLPSASHWRFSLGHGYPGGAWNWGTQEVEAHTASPGNVSLDGEGHLRITPLRDAKGQWTSARIETHRDDFHAPAGGMLRIEARIRMPDVRGAAAIGYWPAFWALGHGFRQQRDWPASGEIDVAENVNGLDRVWGTLHCGVSPGGPCGEKQGLAGNAPCPGSRCQAAFHTYTAEWDRRTHPQLLRWYVDGQLYHSLRQDQVPADTWQRMSARDGMFLILDVAIGGEFPDAMGAPARTPTRTTEPGHPMLVDYVAVWIKAD